MMNTEQSPRRRYVGAVSGDDARAYFDETEAGSAGPVSGPVSYQASVEPMRRPDHKSKRHSRPHRWEDRHASRNRQAREWAL